MLSGLEQDDMKIIYKYVCEYLNDPASSLNGPNGSAYGIRNRSINDGYALGPSSVDTLAVYAGANFAEFNLVVYRGKDVSIIFLVEQIDTEDFFRCANAAHAHAHAHARLLMLCSQLDHVVKPEIDNLLGKTLKENYNRRHRFACNAAVDVCGCVCGRVDVCVYMCA